MNSMVLVCVRTDVWSSTPHGFAIFGKWDNALAECVLPSLYMMVKSYSRNSNNHLTIHPGSYCLLTR
jgi:hypothetical protein